MFELSEILAAIFGFALGLVARDPLATALRRTGGERVDKAEAGPAAAFDTCTRALEEVGADRFYVTVDGNPLAHAVDARQARVACFGCGALEVVGGSFRHADTCPDWPGLAVPIAEVLRQAKPVPEVDTSSWPDWP